MQRAELEQLLPYSSHFLEIDGFKMHYLDEGSGSVVVLLHGNPTWCFYYRNLIESLKDKYRVIACDFIGCGLSDHPKNVHFTALERVEQFTKFVEKLELQRFSLVMHDWGGSIGSTFAVRNVEKIEKLIYLNTTLTETESLPVLIKKAARPILGKYLTKYSKWFLKVTTAQGLGVVNKLPHNVRQAYLYPYRTIARRTAIWDFVADIPFKESDKSYAGVQELRNCLPRLAEIPVQIIWGMKDPCFHVGMLNKVAAHFPQAYILEIEDASHLVLEDAPQLTCTNIRQFLAQPPYLIHKHNRANELNVLYKSFLQQVSDKPEDKAVLIPSFTGNTVKYQHVSYQELNGLINQYQRGLSDAGLRCGDKVVMLVSPGIDFLALSYAVMGRGGVPIFLDPGMGIDKLLHCIEVANPAGFILSPKAHLLRLKNTKIFKRAKFHVTVGDWFPLAGLTTSKFAKFSRKNLTEVTSSGTALIAYTSGATGTPKGVVYTDVMMSEQLRIFKDVFGFSSEQSEKDLPLLPVFSLFTVAMGVCSVFPPVNPARPLELNPKEIVRLINELQIAYSFGSPALWNKISKYCVEANVVLPSLKKVFLAGAPVQKDTLERLKILLKNGNATTPYGATEALPVTLISMSQILDADLVPAVSGEQGVLVGKQLSSMRIGVIEAFSGEISDISEVKWLPSFHIGEIIVSGRNVSPAYFEQLEATKLAKIKDGEAFWHRMGDMGYLDAEGNLYFCGRKAHVVKTESKIYYSVPTEAIFNQHTKVARSALVHLAHSNEAAIVVEPLVWKDVSSRDKREKFILELSALAKNNSITADINKFFFYKSFPVDGRHNAKIFREKLALWADLEDQKGC